MRKLTIALAIAATTSLACVSASANTNGQRCQNLDSEIKKQYQAAVAARMPTTDPTTFSQETFDIEAIMNIDVSAGLTKLLNLDFSAIMQKVLVKVTKMAMKKAVSEVNNKLRSTINSVAPPSISGALSNTATNYVTNVGNQAGTAITTGPYGR